MAKAKTKGSNAPNPSEMSKKELETKRKEISKYYEDHIPSLKIQLEYEQLLKDIEKTRAERLQAQMFVAQTMAEPPAADDMPQKPSANGIDPNTMSGEEAAEEIKRTLKKSI